MNIFIIIALIIILIVLALLGRGKAKVERSAKPAAPVTDTPYNLVSTFKRDPATSRAFTWYSRQANADGWLEVAKDGADSFTAAKAIQVQAASSSIKTDQGKRGVHKAEITGLEPGTFYTYRVGSREEGQWSAVYTFSTAAADSESVTFINVTDSQGETAEDFAIWGRTLKQAFTCFPAAQFIVHNGDFTEKPEDSAAWNRLFGNVQERVASVPLMPVTGNHDQVHEEAAAFASHFNLPDNGAQDSIAGTSYSFDYGPVHVTVLNTESNLKQQTNWLKKDLAGTDKPWKIVALHRPLYGGNMYSKLEDWAKVFDKYKVDLVLQGHNHEYSRSYPLRAGKVVSERDDSAESVGGTVYVVTNASGTKFNEKKEDLFYHKVHFQNHKPMFAGITVSGDTLSYEAYDVDGSKLDEFVLKH